MVCVWVTELLGQVSETEGDRDVDILRLCEVDELSEYDKLSLTVVERVRVGDGVGGGVMVGVTVIDVVGCERDGDRDTEPEVVKDIVLVRLSVRAVRD